MVFWISRVEAAPTPFSDDINIKAGLPRERDGASRSVSHRGLFLLGNVIMWLD